MIAAAVLPTFTGDRDPAARRQGKVSLDDPITDIEHKGSAPTTLVGQAITQVISPKHVYALPAAPTGDE